MDSLDEDSIVIRKLSYIQERCRDYWTLGLRRREMGSVTCITIFLGSADADDDSLLSEGKIFCVSPISGLLLVEHARTQIDLTVLQFLRSAVGSFSIYPNGDPFDVFLALHQRRDLSYAPGRSFAPDSVIARQRKNERPVGVEGAHSFALGPD